MEASQYTFFQQVYPFLIPMIAFSFVLYELKKLKVKVSALKKIKEHRQAESIRKSINASYLKIILYFFVMLVPLTIALNQ